MENKTKDYDQYCKALDVLENATDVELKRKENNLRVYTNFYKKTDEVIRIFTEKTEMKNLNITNLLIHHRNSLNEKVLSHIKANGGFLQ